MSGAGPDPRRGERADALLGAIRRESSGRLKVFLGAAPGVGKTYAMLGLAQVLKRQGVDVVVGTAQTHGRAETQALLEGLEVLPPRQVPYKGHVLEELDLDALLARRPAVALVDELAHRNAPGSRHPHRYQDIDELLDAGIDVHTTVNIQHLESLNDIVYRITGVRVTETVPDSVFDRLRDIVLIDLPPRELIERLEQGKVYVPEQAARALQAFFSPTNLTALRELAMQTAANRVDSDLRESQAVRGLPGLPLRRRVLVAIDGQGQSEYLVRIGRRLAERRDAPWTVVTVQRSGAPLPVQQLEVDRAMALARRLGGDAEILHGGDVVETLLDYAVRNGVSSIVIGRTRDRPFARMVNRTLTQQLIQRGAHYELTIVSTPRARARARRSMRELPGLLTRSDFVLALAATVLATLAAWIVQRWWAGLDDVSLIFMVAVVVVASRTRMAAAVLAAVLSFLAYDFFFIPPVFTLYIGARMGVATALTFLAAALVAGRLASKLRMQVVALRAANAHATALETLGRRLASATTQADVAAAARDVLGSALEADVAVWLKDAPADAALPPLDDKDRAAADWALAHAQPAGRYTGTLAASAWWFLPLLSDGAALGVAGLRLADSVRRLAPEQERLALAMVADIAQALIRSRLAAELEDARVNGETERLRSALLSSVSHDLRSPLAAIIGAAGSLENYAEAMDGADRRDLLETIRLEGERLDRYIQNLLDMTRLGHGAIPLRRDWIGVDELIGSAVTRLQRYEPQARFAVRVAEGMAPIWVHPALIEQALFNVLENAVKFSPPGVPVEVDARLEGDSLVVDVRDRGPGIAEEERLRIFDMFYSVERGDRGGKGTGLGLAICKGMIGAHGGSVVALTPADGPGTLIRIVLPLRYASAP
ncbi:sensor histidine kinase KdpD [Dokdonella sp.]|uniref:sensor histidine kinase n=1 Tax=Dokdonella sp. TaxID=2291710 RepID=UPI002612C21F|nr:sensor histidine kinase KdpD [Dokdonella sp.]